MPKTALTLDEIAAMNREMLTPEIVSRCWGVSQYAVNILAKKNRLPFPYIINGNRVYVAKEGFLKWMKGERAETEKA